MFQFILMLLISITFFQHVLGSQQHFKIPMQPVVKATMKYPTELSSSLGNFQDPQILIQLACVEQKKIIELTKSKTVPTPCNSYNNEMNSTYSLNQEEQKQDLENFTRLEKALNYRKRYQQNMSRANIDIRNIENQQIEIIGNYLTQNQYNELIHINNQTKIALNKINTCIDTSVPLIHNNKNQD